MLLFLVKVSPVFRRYPPGIRRLTAFCEYLGFYNIEDLFGIDVTANVAFAFVIIGMLDFSFEILD